MDFNRPITYQLGDGTTLDLNSIAASDVTTPAPRGGYKVMSARFNEVPMVGYIDKRALQDGVDVGDSFLAMRSMSIVCGVFGTSTGDLHDKVTNSSVRFAQSLVGMRMTTALGSWRSPRLPSIPRPTLLDSLTW